MTRLFHWHVYPWFRKVLMNHGLDKQQYASYPWLYDVWNMKHNTFVTVNNVLLGQPDWYCKDHQGTIYDIPFSSMWCFWIWNGFFTHNCSSKTWQPEKILDNDLKSSPQNEIFWSSLTFISTSNVIPRQLINTNFSVCMPPSYETCSPKTHSYNG